MKNTSFGRSPVGAVSGPRLPPPRYGGARPARGANLPAATAAVGSRGAEWQAGQVALKRWPGPTMTPRLRLLLRGLFGKEITQRAGPAALAAGESGPAVFADLR